MVSGKLQYAQVQMLLGNGALYKYVIFYTESMLLTHTGWGNGCVNRCTLEKIRFVFKKTCAYFFFKQWLYNYKYPLHLEAQKQHSFKRVNISLPEVLTN